MKIFFGWRDTVGAHVSQFEIGDKLSSPLPMRLDLRNHSPTGFEWGYGGSGPAQLALALAAAVCESDDEAQLVYQSLKWSLVCSLPKDGWAVSEFQVRHALTVRRRLELTQEQLDAWIQIKDKMGLQNDDKLLQAAVNALRWTLDLHALLNEHESAAGDDHPTPDWPNADRPAQT